MQNWLPNVDGLPSPKESLNLGNLFDSVSAAHNAIRKSAALVKSASTDAVSRVPSSSVLYEGAKELVRQSQVLTGGWGTVSQCVSDSLRHSGFLFRIVGLIWCSYGRTVALVEVVIG